jgi:hypothetical protein
MCAGGASPCRHCGPSTTVVGIDIDRNRAVTDIDTEQRGSVLTDVVIVLRDQPGRDEVIVASEGIVIRLFHGDLDHGRPISSTVPQRCAAPPSSVYARGGRRGISDRLAQRRQESEKDKQRQRHSRTDLGLGFMFVEYLRNRSPVPEMKREGHREDRHRLETTASGGGTGREHELT